MSSVLEAVAGLVAGLAGGLGCVVLYDVHDTIILVLRILQVLHRVI